MADIREYVTENGHSPFGEWFERLQSPASEKVATGVLRMSRGNLSNAKSIGSGVFEYRIDFGPGYRIYFGYDGTTVVILLGGGTKQRQERDIRLALQRWADYKARRGARRWC